MADKTTYRGKYEERDFWWDDPTDSDRYYRDVNNVRWLVRHEVQEDGNVKWLARPADAAGLRRYGTKAGTWAIEALEFGGQGGSIAAGVARLRKAFEATAETIDDLVGKKQGFPWWLIAVVAVVSRKRRR